MSHITKHPFNASHIPTIRVDAPLKKDVMDMEKAASYLPTPSSATFPTAFPTQPQSQPLPQQPQQPQQPQ